MKISVIVPAFNEEKNIVRVLLLLKTIKGIDEIIVVDDGSVDRTSSFASFISGVKLIKLKKNQGKTKAVMKGIKESKGEGILLFDADLFGVNEDHINEVIETFRLGFDMVIMDYGNQEWILRKILKSLPALSGVRILKKTVFNKIKFDKKDRFELETRINDYYLDHHLNIIVVSADEVRTPHKYEKYSFYKGVYLDVKAIREILMVNGAKNIPKLVSNWWKINAMRKL